nr:PREDICTED: nectin-4 [Struthio camelus australis]
MHMCSRAHACAREATRVHSTVSQDESVAAGAKAAEAQDLAVSVSVSRKGFLALLGLAMFTAATVSVFGKNHADWRFSWSYILGWIAVVLVVSAGCRSGVVEVERSVTAVLGQDVVLPCHYRAQEGEKVVQVTWLKQGPAGRSAELAVLNLEHGEHVQESYAGRVLWRAPGALEDGAIVLKNAVQGDEGDYECHLITFPMGNFEGRLTLKVLDLSDASVLGHTEDWQEGMEGATLTCLGDGNPPPTYNWTRLISPFIYLPIYHEVRQVDLVSASVVMVGVIATVLLCVLVVVIIVMALYHKRKTKRISEKYEEELTLTRENSIRRLPPSHSTDTRTQLEETLHLRAESRQGSLRGGSLRGESLRGTSICSAMSEEAEGRSYSTLSTVREIETQTEVPAAPLLPTLEGKEPKEEEEDSSDNPIKQAMTHFVQENGMLQAKPTTNGIYINGRGHLV